MGQKQIVTRTQIAKMAGTDVTHFLNQRARFAAKSYGGRAGLKNVGVLLINLPVGAVASAFHRIYVQTNVSTFLREAAWHGLGLIYSKSRLVILSATQLVVRRMISVIPVQPI